MKITNLTKLYKVKRGEPVKALDDVSFDLPNKGMVFLLGKSGSGKTTLLNLLGGLDTFDGGDIVFGNKSLKNFTSSELDSFRNTCCGFVFQDYNLLPEFTVAENVALSLEIQGKQASKEEISQALKSVDLEGYENRKITELSGGQKQRISIVRALAKTPDVIFADEPTGALDSNTGDDILNLLKQLSKTKLVVVVSHDREFALKYADRIIELKNGRIVSDTVAGFSQKEENLNSSNFVKSKLPFKSALKIGTGNFKLNKGKFITVVLLAVIVFSLLGSSFCFALFDADKAFVNYIYDKSDMEYFGIYKNLRFVDVGAGGGLAFLSNYVSYAQHEVPLTKDDINLLNKNTKDSVIPVNRSDTILTQSHWASTSEERQGFWNAGGRFEANSTGSAVLNTQSMEKLGYTIVGSLPKNKNEIAINQYTYYGFTIAGFKDIYGTVHPIDSPDDMIGLKIKTSNTLYNARQANPDFLGKPEELEPFCKTITGVVDTKRYVGNIETPDNKAFVSEDCFLEYDFLLAFMPQTKSEFRDFAYFYRNFSQPTTETFYIGGFTINGGNYVFATEENDYFNNFRGSIYVATEFTVVFIGLSIVSFVIAFGFLLKVISDTMSKKSKQIGILRAIGMNFGGLFKIFIINAFSILLPVFAFSVVGTIFTNILLNVFVTGGSGVASFPLWQFNILPILAILGACIIVAFLGCIFPLLSAARQSPARVIHKGQRN